MAAKKKKESMKQKESEETPTGSKAIPAGNNDASQESGKAPECASDKTSCKGKSSDKQKDAPSGPAAPTLEELTDALNAEKDRVLRTSAEFENYKKRSAREMADFRKFANETVFKQLLTVVDNLERAIASAVSPSAPHSTDAASTDTASASAPVAASDRSAAQNSIIEGVKMTHKDILKLLESFSVKPVEAEGKPFDPAFHQAVTHQESDEHPNNTVITEFQKGYLLHDRLIRPSMVVVSKSTSKKESKQE